jgi:hypothetical protein
VNLSDATKVTVDTDCYRTVNLMQKITLPLQYFKSLECIMHNFYITVQQKFAKGEYSKISEFVKDVRCLLLNCYTYFGPHDVHTKRALKVERVLEKKISLLPT